MWSRILKALALVVLILIAIALLRQLAISLTPGQRIALAAGMMVGMFVGIMLFFAYLAHETVDARAIDLSTFRIYNLTHRGYSKLLEWLKKHNLVHRIKPIDCDVRVPGLIGLFKKRSVQRVPLFIFWRLPIDPETEEIVWSELKPEDIAKTMYIDIQELFGNLEYVRKIEEQLTQLVEEVTYYRGRLVGLARLEAKRLLDKFIKTLRGTEEVGGVQ